MEPGPDGDASAGRPGGLMQCGEFVTIKMQDITLVMNEIKNDLAETLGRVQSKFLILQNRVKALEYFLGVQQVQQPRSHLRRAYSTWPGAEGATILQQPFSTRSVPEVGDHLVLA